MQREEDPPLGAVVLLPGALVGDRLVGVLVVDVVEVVVVDAVRAYRERAVATDEAVRRLGDLTTPCTEGESTDLRWVLLHLINETARHAGHADATRELLDGTTGE